MHGMAATVGNDNVSLNMTTQNVSQNICIRYIPKLNFESSVMMRGAVFASMQLNRRNVPNVSITQLMVQNAQPISITGVECTTPGIAWL